MIKADYHMHTSYSVDAGDTMQNMIERAITIGLDEIALTDHVDYQADGNPFPYQIDYERYCVEFNQLREKYASRITVVFGVELGLAPRIFEQCKSFAASYGFEFIIGSSHELQNKDLFIHRSEVYGGRTKIEAYTAYFQEILDNIRLFTCFDVYGHLDYIARYTPYEDNTLRYGDYADILDTILKTLIENGKGIELNTSGFRPGYNPPHPLWDVFKRYKQLGGDIVTVGSDAHDAGAIGRSFDKACILLEEAGFKAYTVFKNRKPVWRDL